MAASLPAAVVRRFPQARAQATYLALLDAAQGEFSRRGFDATQTPDIAAAAGVSVGTFYRYFDDKRQVFVEMTRVHLARAHADVMSRLSPERFAVGDHRATIDAVVEVLFSHVRKFPGLERNMLEMSLRDDEVAAARESFEALGHEALTKLIAAIVPRRTVPDPRAAAHVIEVAAVESAIAQAGVRAGRRRVSDRAARAALSDMIHRFLFPDERVAAGVEKRRR